VLGRCGGEGQKKRGQPPAERGGKGESTQYVQGKSIVRSKALFSFTGGSRKVLKHAKPLMSEKWGTLGKRKKENNDKVLRDPRELWRIQTADLLLWKITREGLGEFRRRGRTKGSGCTNTMVIDWLDERKRGKQPVDQGEDAEKKHQEKRPKTKKVNQKSPLHQTSTQSPTYDHKTCRLPQQKGLKE